MLKPEDRECFEEFSSAVKKFFIGADIWAFGSRARGEYSGDSDLDVCVVLDEVTWERRRHISDIAWEVGFEREVLISTVVFSREQFENGPCSMSPLVKSIREEGVAV